MNKRNFRVINIYITKHIFFSFVISSMFLLSSLISSFVFQFLVWLRYNVSLSLMINKWSLQKLVLDEEILGGCLYRLLADLVKQALQDAMMEHPSSFAGIVFKTYCGSKNRFYAWNWQENWRTTRFFVVVVVSTCVLIRLILAGVVLALKKWLSIAFTSTTHANQLGTSRWVFEHIKYYSACNFSSHCHILSYYNSIISLEWKRLQESIVAL